MRSQNVASSCLALHLAASATIAQQTLGRVELGNLAKGAVAGGVSISHLWTQHRKEVE
jgi:hypothetical protein